MEQHVMEKQKISEKNGQLVFGPFSEKTELDCETLFVEMYDLLEAFGQDSVLLEVNHRLVNLRQPDEPAWSLKLKVFVEEIGLSLAWRAFRINRVARVLGENGPGIFGKIQLKVAASKTDLGQLSVQIEKSAQCYANMVEVLCRQVFSLSGASLAAVKGELMAYALRPGLKAGKRIAGDTREAFYRFAKSCAASTPPVCNKIPDPDVMLQGMSHWAMEMSTIPLDLREIMLRGMTDGGKLTVPCELFGNTCNILRISKKLNWDQMYSTI